MQVAQISGDWWLSVPVTAMASATTDNEQNAFVVPFNAVISGGKFQPAAAVTANGTNFSVLSVRNRTVGTVLPLTRSWAAGNSTAWVADTLTLSGTASDLVCSAGDTLTVQMIHTASGVVIPAGVVLVNFRAR